MGKYESQVLVQVQGNGFRVGIPALSENLQTKRVWHCYSNKLIKGQSWKQLIELKLWSKRTENA